MRVLLAFDKFKGSLTASEACDIAEVAIQEVRPDASIAKRPLTDGGEGFCEIVTQALGGVFRDYKVTYPDLTIGSGKVGYVFLDKIHASIREKLELPEYGMMAIIEMAQAAGHQLVSNQGRNPWFYSSFGVGEMMRYAHAEGATSFLIGMGGSATNDMGIGLLESFGMKAYDESNESIAAISPSKWEAIEKFDAPTNLPDIAVRIACDVKNPLHGDDGAAAVFGPQKGLRADDLETMQTAMGRMDRMLREVFPNSSINSKTPGMGAAGGLPFGLSLAFETKLVPGFELICEILELTAQIQQADIVVTGEGALDKSSLAGKGPYEIIQQGLLHQKQVSVFAGKVFDEAREVLSEENSKTLIYQVGDSDATIDENIRNEKENLKKRVKSAFKEFGA